MVVELGANPWILILLTFLELFYIIIPAFIASKIEHVSFKEELNEMGLNFISKFQYKDIYQILIGIILGLLFYLGGGYIYFFFSYFIVGLIFGTNFVESGTEGAISTQPIQPNLIQLVIFILLQILIVAICEEAFFRGFLISKMEQKIKSYLAIIFSSFFFALYHIPPFLVPVTTFVTFFGYYFSLGLLLSLVYHFANNNLLPTITIHSVFNILIILL